MDLVVQRMSGRRYANSTRGGDLHVQFALRTAVYMNEVPVLEATEPSEQNGGAC